MDTFAIKHSNNPGQRGEQTVGEYLSRLPELITS